MAVFECRMCGKLIKRSKVLWKVYPTDYDHSCCNECNEKAVNQD